MAEFYTLEEAARVLGMSPDELKSKAQEREVRGFLDSGSWQFRKADVEELARRHGLGSDAELRLSDLEVPAAGGAEFEDLDLSEFQLGVAKADLGAETMQFGATPAAEGGSEHDLMIDDLSVPPNPVTGSSSVIIGMSSLGKLPSDSDVRLVPDDIKGASDSDVRLAQPHGRAPSDSDVTLIKDDTSEHGVFAASSSGSSIGPAPLLGSSAEVPAAGADSDFELSPSNELVDALQPESGSDFELSALDASDEFEATPLKPSDSDVTAADPNLSGINLSRPSDSGINLLGAFGGGGAESIELAPLSDEAMPTKKAAPPASPAKPKPSLSATPPPAVGKGEKDIFDDTDFEVDAALDDESDDKTVQLNAGSDFDLEDSDSASEVFAIDEEDVDINAATAMAPANLGDDDDEDDGFDDAVSAEIGTAWASDDSPVSGASTPGVVISREPAADWDGLSVGLLAFASVFVLLSSFLAYDLVRNLYDFNEGGVASGLVKSISGMVFG